MYIVAVVIRAWRSVAGSVPYSSMSDRAKQSPALPSRCGLIHLGRKKNYFTKGKTHESQEEVVIRDVQVLVRCLMPNRCVALEACAGQPRGNIAHCMRMGSNTVRSERSTGLRMGSKSTRYVPDTPRLTHCCAASARVMNGSFSGRTLMSYAISMILAPTMLLKMVSSSFK